MLQAPEFYVAMILLRRSEAPTFLKSVLYQPRLMVQYRQRSGPSSQLSFDENIPDNH